MAGNGVKALENTLWALVFAIQTTVLVIAIYGVWSHP